MKKTFSLTTVVVCLFFGMGWGISSAVIATQWYYGVHPSVILRVYEETLYAAELESCLAGERHEARIKELKQEWACLIEEGCITGHELNHRVCPE